MTGSGRLGSAAVHRVKGRRCVRMLRDVESVGASVWGKCLEGDG